MKTSPDKPVFNFIITCTAFLVLAFMVCLCPADCRAGEAAVPTFGEGNISVRLYTDYFCTPCRQMEPDIEPILTELVRDRIIKLTFIDTPFARYSSLYARYFLYAVNEKNSLDNAFLAKRSLIEAAKKNIGDARKLEAFLGEKKVAFKPFDLKPVFDTLSRHLKEDDIKHTPTCLIVIDAKTYKYEGVPDITAALQKLRQKKSSR